MIYALLCRTYKLIFNEKITWKYQKKMLVKAKILNEKKIVAQCERMKMAEKIWKICNGFFLRFNIQKYFQKAFEFLKKIFFKIPTNFLNVSKYFFKFLISLENF